MGGPVLGFCAGRLDDGSGLASLELGPSPEQESVAPCEVNGECEFPLGTGTVGLIYVNPEGPLGVPDPVGSAANIESIFGEMSMNKRETTALAGGGHAFGKFHGPCTTGPGPNPMDAPNAPYPGTCGETDCPMFGKGENTFTSGFEGKWTEYPTVWDNDYFKNLVEYDWEVMKGPGGHYQWYPVLKEGSTEHELPNVVMLTSDVALLHDEEYLAIVKEYAEDIESLNRNLSEAWYKLATRDMGPHSHSRCSGTDVPSPREFQLPLVESEYSASSDDYKNAEAEVREIVSTNPSIFVTLAHQSASTFRSTDYMGGANGARIRFSPQKDWENNKGLDEVVEYLSSVKKNFDGVSYADLIVMAGNVALETMLPEISFELCDGRLDATGSDEITSVLEPRIYNNTIVGVRDRMKIMGLSVPQMVALAGRPRNKEHMILLGYSGSYTDTVTVSNEFYNILLTNSWEKVPGSDGECKAVGKEDVYALDSDLAVVWDAEFKAQVGLYAENNDLFVKEFTSAWTTLMNADRFDGSTGTVC
ncbi:unnamed protein product [Laminaria digitata]